MLKLILKTLFVLSFHSKKNEVKESFSHFLKEAFKVEKNSNELIEACAIFTKFVKKKYKTSSSKKDIDLYDRLTHLFNQLNEKEKFLYYLYISQQKNATNLIIGFHDKNFIMEMEKKKSILYNTSLDDDISEILTEEEISLLKELENEPENELNKQVAPN